MVTGSSIHIPGLRERLASHFQKEPLGGVDPVSAAAIGAAIQGDLITELEGPCLIGNVTPVSIGIETVDGGFVRVVGRSYIIPTRHQRVVTTAEDDQRAISIKVWLVFG